MNQQKTPFTLSLSKGLSNATNAALRLLSSDRATGYACLLIVATAIGAAYATFLAKTGMLP